MKQYENMKHGTESFPVGIHYTLCETGFSLYPHIHREFEFLVMTKGKGTVYIENEKFEISQGEGVFVNSEELHIGIKTNSEKAEFFAVVFAPEIFGSFGSDVIMQKYVEPVIEKKIVIKRRLDKEAVKMLYDIQDKSGELKIKAVLYSVWDICIKNAEEKGSVVKSKSVDDMKMVMEYIKANCSDPITLEDMAKHVNISKGYLCREFKKVVHMTPFDYLIRMRIDKGCEMLKNTDLSVGEIAILCGFNSFSYFTKIFKKMIDKSPKEYRNIFS